MAKRIAVIGAGLAGLSAANKLVDAGADVTVYEARDRVGGRIWSASVQAAGGEAIIERGAEFFLNGYTAAEALLEKFGLALADTGMSYYVREPIDTPGITAADIVTAGKLAAANMTKPGAAELAAEDVIADIDASPEVIEALRGRIEISTSVPAKTVWSQALMNVASFEPLPSFRVAGGNDRLPKAMAAALGDRVKLKHYVNSVRNLEDGSVEVTVNGTTQSFDAAIVTVPFSVMNTMTDAGALPTDERRELAKQSLVQGHAAKLHLPLAQRPAETSAKMSVADRYWTWTATDESGEIPAVLNGFMASYDAIERSGMFVSPEPWGEQVKASRPDLEIDEGTEAIATLWSVDPFALGGYTAHAAGKHELTPSDLQEPIGQIYWAGEYCDDDFTGLIEGAIRSGIRAAKSALG